MPRIVEPTDEELQERYEAKLCGLCGNPPGEPVKDYLCAGCGTYICEDCERNINMPWGAHHPMAHAEDPYA